MGQYVTALVIGAPSTFSEEEWDCIDERRIIMRQDNAGDLVCIPITSRRDDRWSIAAVALDEIAERFADRISEAQAEWAELTTQLAALGLMLPAPRLYLTTIEVA